MATAPPAPVIDWYALGGTEYLNDKHMPDRMCRIYPTRDRHSEEDERRYLAGWRAAQEADQTQHADMTERENVWGWME
jgi:hypothetical protein